MQRWNGKINAQVEVPEADAFISDIITVCIKHGMTLGHEDEHGAFVIAPSDESSDDMHYDWLRNAHWLE